MSRVVSLIFSLNGNFFNKCLAAVGAYSHCVYHLYAFKRQKKLHLHNGSLPRQLTNYLKAFKSQSKSFQAFVIRLKH